MLSRFAFAQQNYPDCCHQHQNPYDLKRQIVVAEKQRADVPDIISFRPFGSAQDMPCERRKSLSRSLEVSDHKANLSEQNECDANAARGSEPIDPTPFFGWQVKKHDDEKKKHHHRACVNQHLNDSDEVGIERHE